MHEGKHRIAVRAVVHGKVQGVWFRAWTAERADELGLEGWVRNREDGSVEALFSGPADKVGTMLKRCEDGPPAATVTDVERFEAEFPDEPGFRQRPTR